MLKYTIARVLCMFSALGNGVNMKTAEQTPKVNVQSLGRIKVYYQYRKFISFSRIKPYDRKGNLFLTNFVPKALANHCDIVGFEVYVVFSQL